MLGTYDEKLRLALSVHLLACHNSMLKERRGPRAVSTQHPHGGSSSPAHTHRLGSDSAATRLA